MLVTEFAPAELKFSEEPADSLRVTMVSECSLEHASGVNTSVQKVANYLMEQGHEVTVVCPAPAPATLCEAEVISTKSVTIKGFAVGRKSTKGFKEIYNTLQPDVIHVASPMRTPKGMGLFLGGHAIKAANALDVPVTAVYQTDAVRFAEYLGLGLTVPVVERQVRKMHNKADLNLVPSSASERDLIDWGVRQESIRRWGRGVDTALFNPQRRGSEEVLSLRSQWAPNEEVIIGVVSRLEPEKSIHKLAVLKDIPGTKLVIVGEGTQRQSLEELFNGKAIFTGRLNGEDLANAYAAMDIFPFPSTTDTFAQVIQEAKASGVAVVAANRGGPRDLIDHGETGYLYEPTNKQANDTDLLKYVEYFVSSQPLREAIGKAARASVEDRTWEVLGSEIVGHYRDSISVHLGHAALKDYETAIAC